MTWDFYGDGEGFILKEKKKESPKEILDSMDSKQRKKLNKKMKSMDERNVDIVATATKLRKEYELLYRQLRDLIYPKGKGDEKK